MNLFPDFYQPDKVGMRFEPNLGQAIEAGLALKLRPASKDAVQRLGLFIDYQNDFTDFADQPGTLAVKGAVDDVRRAIEWLYRNVEQVSGLMISLDQHLPYQIFYSSWWRDRDGKPPAPFTPITFQEVDKGQWTPLYESTWSKDDYVKTLGQIFIWPYHCMIGTPGAALVPAFAEAVAYVAAARRIQPMYIFKGSVPKTEHYGPFRPCVLVNDHPQGGVNTQMLDAMEKYERIYVFGEAEDFCVSEGMKQTLDYYGGKPAVLSRLRFVRDCTSLVFPDNRDQADQVLAEFSAKGVCLVKSNDPLD